MAKPNPMGATFAERAAAAAGEKDFKDPTPASTDAQENTSFAERAKAAKKTSSKAVDTDDAENKSVKSATKKTAAKKA